MTDSSANLVPETKQEKKHETSIGNWTVVTVLVLLLMASGIIGYLGWTSADNDVPTSGYVAMALGVIFSLVVGVGLMALLFYSSRAGYDEPATFIVEPEPDQDRAQEGSHKP